MSTEKTTPVEVGSNLGLGPVPEGCTPADAAMLRRANHTLADDVHLLQTALADLHRQVQDFVTTYGEADFYTGPALAVLAKTGFPDYRWPYSSPTRDEVISKLLESVGPNDVAERLPWAVRSCALLGAASGC